jgi:hypothetical protein
MIVVRLLKSKRMLPVTVRSWPRPAHRDWRRATNITVLSGNSIEEEHSKNAGEEQNPDDNHRRAGHTRHNGACCSVLLKGNKQR